MTTRILQKISALSLLAVLAGGATWAQAQQQVQARVISTSPVTQSNGSIRYHVTYEYAGRQYTTQANTPPGASIMVNLSDYGVATSAPVAPQPQLAPNQPDNGPQNWADVVPEQGLVVSGTGAPPPGYAGYAQPAPVYAPAPVYYAAPPYYAAPYGYAYPAFPPIGISLGFGYSHGWGGGYGRHWH
jgi:hypothetical protein